MKAHEYLAQTHITAKEGIDLVYLHLGLIGEVGEVTELFKKMLRDDGGMMTEERLRKLELELGDVLWYWSELRRNFDVFIGSPPYSEYVMRTMRDKDVRELVVVLAENAAGVPDIPNVALQRVFSAIETLCNRFDLNVETVMEKNSEKLLRRLAENKISGSGSDR